MGKNTQELHVCKSRKATVQINNAFAVNFIKHIFKRYAKAKPPYSNP
jgi:hypothetical protein